MSQPLRLLWLIIASMFVLSSSGITQAQSRYDILGTPFYDPGEVSVSACSSTGTAGSLSSSTSLDLKAISTKYSLHSALVKQIGGSTVAAYNAEQSPPTVASVLKIIIADAFFQTAPDLNQEVTVSKANFYGGAANPLFNPAPGTKIKLADALEQTLKFSSDTDANVLIDAAGGLKKIGPVLDSLGYKNTQILSYYNEAGSSTPNQTTVTDLTKAMDKVFTSSDNYHTLAQKYLSEETVNFGLSSDANKWGGTSKVTGNSAVFSLNGNRYIVTMYTTQDWKGDAKGTDQSSGAWAIKNATNEIVDALRASPAASPASSAQCCSALSSTNVPANTQDILNFFISKGLQPYQAAGIVGNMMHESGLEPERLQGTNSGVKTPAETLTPTQLSDTSLGWGLVQWTPPGKFINTNSPASLSNSPSVQLDFLWNQLDGTGPVAEKQAGDEIKKTTDVENATVAFQGTEPGSTVTYKNVNYGPYYGYERPGDKQATVGSRIDTARDVLTKFGSGGGSSGTVTLDSSCSGGGSITKPSGNGQELALQLLEKHYKGNINGHAYSGDGKLVCLGLNCNDLDNTAHGVSLINNGGQCAASALGQDLLQALVIVIEQGGFSLSISAMCNDHSTGSSTGGAQSRHNVGEALDVNFVNGKWLCDLASEGDVMKLLQYLNNMIGTSFAPDQVLNQGVGAGQGCSQTSNYIAANDNLSMDNHISSPKFTSKYVGDHENHVHIGY